MKRKKNWKEISVCNGKKIWKEIKNGETTKRKDDTDGFLLLIVLEVFMDVDERGDHTCISGWVIIIAKKQQYKMIVSVLMHL